MSEERSNTLKITYPHWILLIFGILTEIGKNVECENFSDKNQETLHHESGTVDFRHLRLQADSKLFVDKSLLIKEIMDNGTGDLIMINRPCQHGKTTNLKMLQSFLEILTEPSEQLVQRQLFVGGDVEVGGKSRRLEKLAIADHADVMDRHLGNHPVVYFNFRDCAINVNETVLKRWGMQVYRLYCHYGFQKTFDEMFTGPGRVGYYNIVVEGLWELALLIRYNLKKKVIFLIDDYDFLMLDAYVKYGAGSTEYYKIMECLNQMMVIFTSRKVFRVPGIGDPVEKVIFTGVIPFRVFDEMVNQYSIKDEKFSSYFGFVDDEVDNLLDAVPSHRHKESEIKRYYKGYTVGGRVIYNTVSIAKYLKSNGTLRAYWDSGVLSAFDRLPINTTVTAELERFVDRRLCKPVSIGSSFDYSVETVDDAFTLLFYAGFLNCSGSSSCRNCSLLNDECRQILQQKLLNWTNVTFIYMDRSYQRNKLLDAISQFHIRNIKHRTQHLLRMCSVNNLYNGTHRYYVDFLAGLLTERIPHDRYYRDNNSIDVVFLLDSDQGRSGVITTIEASAKGDLGTVARTATRALQLISNSTYVSKLKQNADVRYIFKLAISYHQHSVSVRYHIERRNQTPAEDQFHDFVLTTVRPVKTKIIPNRFKAGNNVVPEDMFERNFIKRLPVNNAMFLEFIDRALELSDNIVVTFKKYLKSKEKCGNVNQTIYRMRNAIVEPDIYISQHAVVLTSSKDLIYNFSKNYTHIIATVVDVVHEFHQDVEVTTVENSVRSIFETLDKSIHL